MAKSKDMYSSRFQSLISVFYSLKKHSPINFMQSLTMVCICMFCLSIPSFAILLKPKALINLNWKFAKGTQAGAEATTFNDASWETVCIPHSASYDAMIGSSEIKHYQGDSWYRKTFTCPPEAQKVFIRFDGAMQSATVYVNGTKVGMHDNCGYDGFSFDISNSILKGKSNVIAVMLNVKYDKNIPPGGNGNNSGSRGDPDFLLFSGLYRNVWLQFKDSVYIPDRGQQITTPGTPTSAAAKATTTIKNEAGSAKEVSVTTKLIDASGVLVETKTVSQSVPAKGSYDFINSTAAITPKLWSPSTPILYSLETTVSVGGTVIDSTAEKIGFRFYSWNTTNGFSINGSRLEIRGVCLHQFMGWIENAVPDSRFAKYVEMVKDMGANSIRCAHYPRAKAFYRACDSLGMLVYVEVPTWGAFSGFTNRPEFWRRMYSIDSSLVLDGFNHPCIYAWGMYNEPYTETFNSQLTNEYNIIRKLDPITETGRVATIANNMGDATRYQFDITGLNYETASSKVTTPIINTEIYMSWSRQFSRGSAMDLDVATGSEADKEVKELVNATKTTDKCAGAHFWCFVDYASFKSGGTTALQGLVDKMFLPKNVYYLMRKTFTNAEPDYWQNGTPTKIDLVADLSTLKADGTDISRITATLRDATGKCLQTACDITFTASPAANVAMLYPGSYSSTTTGNPVTVKVEGGRACVLLRTSTTAGPITVTAKSSCSLADATVNLTSSPVIESFYSGATPVNFKAYEVFTNSIVKLNVVPSGKGYNFRCISPGNAQLSIVNSQGKSVFTSKVPQSGLVFVKRSLLGNGIFYVTLQNGNQKVYSIINTGITR